MDSVGFVAHLGVVRTGSLVRVVVIFDEVVDFCCALCGFVWLPQSNSVGEIAQNHIASCISVYAVPLFVHRIELKKKDTMFDA